MDEHGFLVNKLSFGSHHLEQGKPVDPLTNRFSVVSSEVDSPAAKVGDYSTILH